MIKFVTLLIVPGLAAALCANQVPDAAAIKAFQARQADRQFLATLDVPAVPVESAVSSADKEFLAKLDSNLPVLREVPVRKAIAIHPIAQEPVIEAVVAKTAPDPVEIAPPAPTKAVDLRASLTSPAIDQIDPEVRRAIPVQRQRAAILIYGDQVIISPKYSAR